MIKFSISGEGLKPLNTRWWGATQAEWAPILLQANRKIWPTERDPTNRRPWAPLSPRYNKWKQNNFPGQLKLRLSGTMQSSAEIFPKGSGFVVSSTPYGRYHQFGTSKMPKRPWVGIPDNSLKQLASIAWSNILKR